MIVPASLRSDRDRHHIGITDRDQVGISDHLHRKPHEATAGQFQITTDGFKPYVDAVHYSLGTRVDFAQLIKVYATPRDGDLRYSPPEVVDTVPLPRWGQSELSRICT